jgi:hypothetical protein
MAKKKARRVNLSIPSDVANELDALGPVNKSKIAAKAFKREVERIRREGNKSVELKVSNLCPYPVVLTFTDGKSMWLEPRDGPLDSVPQETKGRVLLLEDAAVESSYALSDRWDVWRVPGLS